MPEFEIKISSDARSAKTGIRQTKEELKETRAELKKFVADSSSIGDMATDWIKNAKAIEAAAAAIRKARNEQRQLEAARRDRASQIGNLPGMRGVGSLLSGSASTAGAAAMGAGLASVAAMGHMFTAGQAAENSIARIDQHTGGRGQQVFTAMEDLAGRFGGDSQELLAQSERLVRSGFSSEQAVKVMEHVIVAAQGDVSRMEGLLDELVEAASRGYLEESLLSNLEKNGVNVRQALMEHLNMTKDQLEEALSKGEVDVSTYLGLVDQLTGAGSDAYEASMKASQSTLGQLSNIWAEWKSAWAGMGRALDRFIIKPLADKVLPFVQKYFSLVRKFWDGPDVTQELISETPAGFEKIDPSSAPQKDKLTQKFEAQQKLKAEQEEKAAQQKVTDEAWQLRRSIQSTRADAVWGGMSLTERLASIARNTGLGENLSLAALDEKIIRSEGYTNAQATAEQVEQLRMLINERKKLVELEKAEKVASAQVKQQRDILDAAEQRRQLQEAELAGDQKRLQVLKDCAEAQRLYNSYVQAGVDSGTALRLTSEEIARKSALQAKNSGQQAPSSGGQPSGWLESSLSEVGGGGIRVRNFEASAVDIARGTQKNTDSIATSAEAILDYLKNGDGMRGAVLY